jgi:hypothetical protein
MATNIPLTNSEQYALVDDEDADRVNSYRWYVGTKGYILAYLGQAEDSRPIFAKLHRFVLDLHPGDLGVDHRNRDKLDNRKENLRLATQTQNRQNLSRFSAHARSGYRNVYWVSAKQAWRGSLRLGSTTKTTKYFTDLDEAIEATRKLRLAWMPYATE